MVRDVKASAPSRPWLMWLCPGANHAPHHVAEEWADRYKGQFDDGYEAYREWALPRMIEKGILPEGTELTPMNPMPDGTYSELGRRPPMGLAERRREAPVRTDGRGVRGVLRIHRPSGRAGRRLPGGDRAAREHAHPVLRRQRRVRRGQPERLGQREQVLQRLAGRDGGEPEARRRPRQPEHLQPLPDRLGVRVLDAVPDVQALLLPGRRVRSAGRSTGRRASGPGARCAISTTTRSTSSRRSSTAAASSSRRR